MLGQAWDQLITFSGQFVTPDWGALVLLLPVFLLVLVVVYVAWLLYRLGTAGPKRRGMRRLAPVAPEGIHMPGPTFAPFLAAFGALMTVFGVVTGGIWLWVGLVILVITLLYWGREALRDYDHIPEVAAEHGIAAGALPPPGGTPPLGVHIPAPSFRPLLVALAMAILVGGLVVGGWALVLGLAAVLITGLGWLRDARREYVAAEEADRTGHLDAGGAPSWPRATFATLGILVLVAVVVSVGLVGGSGGGTATPSGGPVPSAGTGGGTAGGGGAGPSKAPVASLPAADVVITAEGIQYTDAAVTTPAGKPFTIAFDNKDNGVPHDIVIKDGSGAVKFQGEVVTGVAVKVYDVPALPAGQYPFACSIHPNMTGTITAQ